MRTLIELTFDDNSCTDGLVYIADQHNAAYLGPASELQIAQQIAGAEGPSGANRDYLFELANALRMLGQTDDHVTAIEGHLLQLTHRIQTTASSLNRTPSERL